MTALGDEQEILSNKATVVELDKRVKELFGLVQMEASLSPMLKLKMDSFSHFVSKQVIPKLDFISAEELEKQRSIVISGLPESKGALADQLREDHKAVMEIVSELGVYAAPSQVYRLGKPGQSKPRLIKCILATRTQQRAIIQAAKKLRGSVKFNNVFLRPSMSKEEREANKKLVDELRERRKNEGDLVIYKNKIVKRSEIKKPGNVRR